MLILAVDTTTPCGSVALLENARLRLEVNSESPSTHSERLLPSVDFVLKSEGLSVSDLDAYAVAVGPGSFTGIRIGLSLIKSFAFSTGKPVAPVSALKALALKLSHPHNRLLCPMLDARKGEIYAALFESKKGDLHELIPQGVYSPDQFLAELPAHRIISFIGSGAEVFRDRIFDYIKDKSRFSQRACFIANEVGRLGFQILKEGKGISSEGVQPLYFRKSQAEENH
jgi:tRNA threonylcarbamoyladenosine biosynthesis protein TsaB